MTITKTGIDAERPKTFPWPFPPPTGPVPWTKKQIAEYERAKRDQAEEAPL